MARHRKLSAAQKRYAEARTAFDLAAGRYAENTKLYTNEANKLQGSDDPFPILPEDHPLAVKGQACLDIYNAALREMHASANAMFDWALDTTFARMGTEEQKRNIRESFETIKRKSHVEKLWKDAIDITMRLAA
jgi:hypothetical protein